MQKVEAESASAAPGQGLKESKRGLETEGASAARLDGYQEKARKKAETEGASNARLDGEYAPLP
jgi:hypothetical protein